MLSKPSWYKMLPKSVKPMTSQQIKNVEYFRKKWRLNDEMILMGIMTSPWAVAKIQKYTLAKLKKRMPKASQKELWKQVILSRLSTKLTTPPGSDPFSNPLSEEELTCRMDNVEDIVSEFNSFDDVIDYIIKMDEEENRFFDPSGLQNELNEALEKSH